MTINSKTVHKFTWPIWPLAIVQGVFYFAARIFEGRLDSPFGDWIFARHCNYGWCDGALFLLCAWILFAVVLIGNTLFLLLRRRRS